MNKAKVKEVKETIGMIGILLLVLLVFGAMVWGFVDSQVASSKLRKFCSEKMGVEYKHDDWVPLSRIYKYKYERIDSTHINCCKVEPSLNSDGVYEKWHCKGYVNT